MCDKCGIQELMGGTMVAINLRPVIKAGDGFLIKSFDTIEAEVNSVLAEAWTIIEPTAREHNEYDFAQEQITNLAMFLYSGYQGATLNAYAQIGNPTLWEVADALGERNFKLSEA